MAKKARKVMKKRKSSKKKTKRVVKSKPIKSKLIKKKKLAQRVKSKPIKSKPTRRKMIKRKSSKPKTAKPKVGIFGITGCMGCRLNIAFQETLPSILDKIDLIFCDMLKEKNNPDGPFDVVFLEGVVVSDHEAKFVQELRKKTKLLVAIGSCATDGCVHQIINSIDRGKAIQRTYHTSFPKDSIPPAPIDKFVKVDFKIRGCPMDKEEFYHFFNQFVLGKKPKIMEKSICHKCNLQGNKCLLENGEDCMGPVTTGNCSVMCPHVGKKCTGCRGPYTDANFKGFVELLKEKGFSDEYIVKCLNKYAGATVKELIEGINKDEKKKGEHCYFKL